MLMTLGFSPCPNDAFIFDALVHRKIDTGPLRFEPVLEDVETLNQWALQGKLDITKLSFPAFFRSLETYILLHSGSALGKGAGPLLVSGQEKNWTEDAIAESRIILPGENTTAHLLFSFACPGALQKQFMVFSGIEEAVARGEAGLGVIIHENRFTYREKGLYKVKDLGEYWEQKMNVPVPLGGIAIKRSIDPALAARVDQLVRESLSYAFKRQPLIPDYVKEHAQSMREEVMRQHIELYVNEFSLDLGPAGKEAIEVLYAEYLRLKNQSAVKSQPLFL